MQCDACISTLLKFFNETQTLDIAFMAMWVLGGLLFYQNNEAKHEKQNIKN